jgi:hypothetical protein
MKLKCGSHGRRVLSIGNNFAHRTGDMSKCDSKTAVMVDSTSHITRSFHIVNGSVEELSCDKKQRPHTPRKH